MILEITKEAVVAITENKMIVKQAKEKTDDKAIIKLCDMYIDLAEAITNNIRESL